MAKKVVNKPVATNGGILLIITEQFYNRIGAKSLWSRREDGYYQMSIQAETVNLFLAKYGMEMTPHQEQGYVNISEIGSGEYFGVGYWFTDWELFRPVKSKKR